MQAAIPGAMFFPLGFITAAVVIFINDALEPFGKLDAHDLVDLFELVNRLCKQSLQNLDFGIGELDRIDLVHILIAENINGDIIPVRSLCSHDCR